MGAVIRLFLLIAILLRQHQPAFALALVAEQQKPSLQLAGKLFLRSLRLAGSPLKLGLLGGHAATPGNAEAQ